MAHPNRAEHAPQASQAVIPFPEKGGHPNEADITQMAAVLFRKAYSAMLWGKCMAACNRHASGHLRYVRLLF